jgi:RNA polymerase sigma-70 factor, ECF subfamily
MNKGPTPVQDTDADGALVQAATSGDLPAFDDLVRRHKDRVFNLCFWFLSDYQEADDMAQEVFIKAFRSLKSFRFEAKFSTWLYRVAVNTCKNRVNSLEYRLKKWTDRLDTGDMPPGDAADEDHSRQTFSPQEHLEQKERMQQIQKAVNGLSGDKKTVVLLRDIEGLAYDEIARITGLAIGTVKSKIARARMELQLQLKDMIRF